MSYNAGSSVGIAAAVAASSQERNNLIKNIIIKNKNCRGNNMQELLEKFVGKYVSIRTINDSYYLTKFIVKEVSSNSLLLENKNAEKFLINTDFIISIKEEKPWKR